jgi:hypothetical protein
MLSIPACHRVCAGILLVCARARLCVWVCLWVCICTSTRVYSARVRVVFCWLCIYSYNNRIRSFLILTNVDIYKSVQESISRGWCPYHGGDREKYRPISARQSQDRWLRRRTSNEWNEDYIRDIHIYWSAAGGVSVDLYHYATRGVLCVGSIESRYTQINPYSIQVW